MNGAVIYALTLLAFVATGDAAAAVPLRSPSAVQEARNDNFGKNYRTGKNGVVQAPKTIAPKKQKSKQGKRATKAANTGGAVKVKQPKVQAPPQSVYNSNLVDKTLGPMR